MILTGHTHQTFRVLFVLLKSSLHILEELGYQQGVLKLFVCEESQSQFLLVLFHGLDVADSFLAWKCRTSSGLQFDISCI